MHSRADIFVGGIASCALFVALAAPISANRLGYDIWFSGRILTVDHRHASVRIARGPTETSGPRIEECALRRPGLDAVRPGMLVQAQADTRKHPWRILHLRVFHRVSAPAPRDVAPGVAVFSDRRSSRGDAE